MPTSTGMVYYRTEVLSSDFCKFIFNQKCIIMYFDYYLVIYNKHLIFVNLIYIYVKHKL